MDTQYTLQPPYKLKFILCGSSGTGKTTMAHILCDRLGLERCVTSTTRPPRAGEKDGVDYHFVKEIHPDEMFEYSTFGQEVYGTPLTALNKGDFIILEPQGIEYFRKHFSGDLFVIQLSRTDIQVDPERRQRDIDAGFDNIHPDVLITGETIEEMAEKLISAVENNILLERTDDVCIAYEENTETQTRGLDAILEDIEYNKGKGNTGSLIKSPLSQIDTNKEF